MNKKQDLKHSVESEEKRNANPYALYIHFPYCLRRCPYCDFNTYAATRVPDEEFVTTILSEFKKRKDEKTWAERSIGTIFFGGGTPSLLSAKSIERIIKAVGKVPEITIETNPGSIKEDKLVDFFAAGVTRISFGSQSFDANILKTLGRDHTPNDIFNAVSAARNAGFKNISLDIIYGVPGQNAEMLKKDLDLALSLEPQHISTYNLTIEKGTPFFEMRAKGSLILPIEDQIIQMMDLIESYLPKNNFARYEISNYAKEGYECLHNLAYWNGDDYLGLGPGAHSYAKPRRWANTALPTDYQKRIEESGFAESWSEELGENEQLFEFWFTGLRKTAGLSCSSFERMFGINPLQHYQNTLKELATLGFLYTKDDHIILTQSGLRMYDSIIEKFIQ